MEARIQFLEGQLADRDEHIRQVVEAATQAAVAAAAAPQPANPAAHQAAQAAYQAAIQSMHARKSNRDDETQGRKYSSMARCSRPQRLYFDIERSIPATRGERDVAQRIQDKETGT